MTSKAFLTVAAALLLGQVTSAHHSWAGFSTDPITVEGRIEEVKIANPHVTIQVRGDDEQRYMVVWQALPALARRGFNVDGPGGLKDLLKPGDRIKVRGTVKRTEVSVEMGPMEMDVAAHGRIWPRNWK